MRLPELVYFKPSEFGDWHGVMSPRLLVLLDTFRHKWGASVKISPVDGALGRHMGKEAQSLHNVDVYGEVRAADIFPYGMDSKEDMERAIKLAKDLGFTGIGVYPAWRPSPGLHLDVRTDKRPGHPAMWGAIRSGVSGTQEYVSMKLALEQAA